MLLKRRPVGVRVVVTAALLCPTVAGCGQAGPRRLGVVASTTLTTQNPPSRRSESPGQPSTTEGLNAGSDRGRRRTELLDAYARSTSDSERAEIGGQLAKEFPDEQHGASLADNPSNEVVSLQEAAAWWQVGLLVPRRVPTGATEEAVASSFGGGRRGDPTHAESRVGIFFTRAPYGVRESDYNTVIAHGGISLVVSHWSDRAYGAQAAQVGTKPTNVRGHAALERTLQPPQSPIAIQTFVWGEDLPSGSRVQVELAGSPGSWSTADLQSFADSLRVFSG